MYGISNFFASTTNKYNIYCDIFHDILIKRRNKLLTMYNILNIHSLNTKKKIEDIMLDKILIQEAISKIKDNDNILIYYYCKDDKIFYLFEYTLTPNTRTKKNDNIEIKLCENIDYQFAINLNVEVVKQLSSDPLKYINFTPNKNIIKELLTNKDDKTLQYILENYNVNFYDETKNNFVNYNEILDISLALNNAIIVNILNKFYYEKPDRKIIIYNNENKYISLYKKYQEHILLANIILLNFTSLCYFLYFVFFR